MQEFSPLLVLSQHLYLAPLISYRKHNTLAMVKNLRKRSLTTPWEHLHTEKDKPIDVFPQLGNQIHRLNSVLDQMFTKLGQEIDGLFEERVNTNYAHFGVIICKNFHSHLLLTI
jgi:hypothetical protein